MPLPEIFYEPTPYNTPPYVFLYENGEEEIYVGLPTGKSFSEWIYIQINSAPDSIPKCYPPPGAMIDGQIVTLTDGTKFDYPNLLNEYFEWQR